MAHACKMLQYLYNCDHLVEHIKDWAKEFMEVLI